MVKVLKTTGLIHLDLSDFVKAAEATSEAIVIARNIGWEGGLSTTLNIMGRLKIRLGDYREAEELLHESTSTARRIGDRWRLGMALLYLGDCFQRQSRLKEAVPVLEEAGLLWHDLSQPIPLKRVASTLVELKSNQGDWEGVLLWRDYIIAACRSQNQQREVAEHLEEKGQILVKLQRHDEAALHFEAAMLAFGKNGYLARRKWRRQLRQLCAVTTVVMKWERRLPLLCDMKKLQRRLPQLFTASLKLPVRITNGEP
ncbi:hypothetical protein M407DRAFT_26985 [Tulasnella calospora MUT 4182]|uniref:MalT-like TPR region domain-containing protein n=1 Tax=Tulasnella calospora MUT 4182 TaxID=1051891 RepID=A0A0C3LQ37_9AGAM|nr:hypothetical protein M407DRAFT_26985 [Tulasnella calospora MUT 4182]